MKNKITINPRDFMPVIVGINAFEYIYCPKLLGIYSYLSFLYQGLDQKYKEDMSQDEIMDKFTKDLMNKFQISKRLTNIYLNKIYDLQIINGYVSGF